MTENAEYKHFRQQNAVGTLINFQACQGLKILPR